MNLKRRCCCDFPAAPIRYIEVEPVIAIPEQCILVGNLSWWVDLNDVVEVSPGFVLYEGGDASSFGQPITVGDDPVFVWNDSNPTVWWADNDITGGTNLGKIFSLRHRGWRIKQGGRRVDFQGLAEVGGTRIVWDLPSAASDDLIDQVQDGGFFFLPQEFSDTPALVQQRSSTDFNGDAVTFSVGYNPRKECVKPEQGRYYGSAAHQGLLFDFTQQFPNNITLEFVYKFRATSSSSPLETYTINKTYEKFVAGGGSNPTVELEDGVLVVTGFDDQDPEDSDYIKFGYRAVRPFVRTDGGAGITRTISAPSIPFYYFSLGKEENFGGQSSSVGDAQLAIGEGSNLQGILRTNVAFFTTPKSDFVPHKRRVGDVMQDVTYAPDLGDIAGLLGKVSGMAQFPPTTTPITNQGSSAGSYKGAFALDHNYTHSMMDAHIGFIRQDIMISTNSTNNAARGVEAFPTTSVPVLAWGTDAGSLSLQSMTNPIVGGYHRLTDGLPSGVTQVFNLGGFSDPDALPPPEVSLS